MMILDKSEAIPVGQTAFRAEKDLPPPYVRSGGPSSVSEPPQPRVPPKPSNLAVVPAAQPPNPNISMDRLIFQPSVVSRVNNYWLHSKTTPISGTFIVDTCNPSTTFGDCHKRARMPATRKNKIFFKQKHIIPNASFHTRHNSINVNLSVDSSGTSQNKAYISARSRHGRVFLNVTSLKPKSHALFEVETRHGAITLFLPPTFDGLIQIRRRHGSVEFLPEFARNARVVQGSDKGSLIRYAGPDSVTPTSTIIESDLMSDWLDHCLVGSRTGKIVIGISGVDVYEPPKVSTLIKRVKGMFLTQ